MKSLLNAGGAPQTKPEGTLKPKGDQGRLKA